jgi:hypothetical protein
MAHFNEAHHAAVDAIRRRRTFGPETAHSVHSSRVSKTPITAFCTKCGKAYFVSFQYFTHDRGACDCSWTCCKEAMPGNRDHGRHIGHRESTPQDLEQVALGTVRDFRGR